VGGVFAEPGGLVSEESKGGAVNLEEAKFCEAEKVLEHALGDGWWHSSFVGTGHEIGLVALHGAE
jgi:hypothetical protein